MPTLAASMAKTIDQQFKNSSAPTKTGTEQAFQRELSVRMWGNVESG